MFNSWMFYLILALSASTAALGWLSLSLHDDKVVAVEALKEAREAVAGYQKALNLKYLSCQIDDSIASEYQIEKNASNVLKDKELSAIDKIPSRPSVQTPLKVPLNESSVVDIDGTLPDDLQRLLSESYDRTRGSVGTDSRQPSN